MTQTGISWQTSSIGRIQIEDISPDALEERRSVLLACLTPAWEDARVDFVGQREPGFRRQQSRPLEVVAQAPGADAVQIALEGGPGIGAAEQGHRLEAEDPLHSQDDGERLQGSGKDRRL